MGELFSWYYTGQPFQFLGPAHLAAMAVVVAINVFLFRWRNPGQRARLIFRYSLAFILVADELTWHFWHWSHGQWSVKTMLPLHLCSVLVFVSAIMLVNKNYRLYEFVYFLGIAGASQAILTPDAGIYGFPHFRFFQVFLSHGSIVTAAIYMTVIEGYRPYWKSLVRMIIGINIYMLIIGGVNFWLGSNYMFIAHKPYTPSLIDVLGPWPWYIISLEVIGLALSFLLYLPFALKDRKAQAVAAG